MSERLRVDKKQDAKTIYINKFLSQALTPHLLYEIRGKLSKMSKCISYATNEEVILLHTSQSCINL